MMDSQLHCLYGFRFLMKPEAQQTEMNVRGYFLAGVSENDVQRFERQG